MQTRHLQLHYQIQPLENNNNNIIIIIIGRQYYIITPKEAFVC